VFLAKEVSTNKEYAIKVLEKSHILREKKQQYVHREKEVFSKLNHPFFVKLYFTFQDKNRLYFGLSYAPRGELLDYINKLGCFDVRCTQFYAAEVVLALEELHRHGIIHRDLKPENILLSEDMHIQITDFGSAKILGKATTLEGDTENSEHRRKNSFVGTAQYVSPEVLNSKCAYLSSDLWALGCLVYQLLSGQLPFWGGHEYQIFQKILKLEYEFPDGFPSDGRDLVEKLLIIDPTKRLGCPEMGGIDSLKKHPFFDGIDWENLDKVAPPELLPYLPMKTGDTENLWSNLETGLDDSHLSRLIGIDLHEEAGLEKPTPKPKIDTTPTANNQSSKSTNNDSSITTQKQANKW
jgi:3-phosphoinositide dependent protein kinase-1